VAALTTGRLRLPYPVLADTPDIPRDVRLLSQKLDPALGANGVGAGGIMPIDSASLNQFTVDGGTTKWHLTSLRLSKVMNQCAAMLNLTRANGAPTITGGTNGTITDVWVGTIVPTAMRPEVAVSGLFDSFDSFGYVQLGTNGLIILRGFSTASMNIKPGEGLRITLAYPGN
jgi:hypothetical protein